MASYQDTNTALKYINFLNSTNGQIQQQILFGAIKQTLPENRDLMILDAGCGSGWLAGKLKNQFNNIQACDASAFFIEFAKANYNGVEFALADISRSLPYPQNYFDAVILNMTAPDLSHLEAAFKNLSLILKPSRKLIMTTPNPKYTYPAAVWKRSFIDFILGRKPKLRIKKTPATGAKIQREFGLGQKIDSFHYSLSDYILAAQQAGLKLETNREIRSEVDSQEFDLTYQLYRYPLLLLLEFKKIQQ